MESVSIVSLLTHKEFRFLYPVLPMAMHICGKYLSSATGTEVTEVTEEVDEDTDGEDSAAEDTEVTEKTESEDSHETQMYKRKWCVVMFLIVTNLPLAMYTSLLHQRGTIHVMKYLSDEAALGEDVNYLFLMPCHSTPYYRSAAGGWGQVGLRGQEAVSMA